jgi:hypothetical protein
MFGQLPEWFGIGWLAALPGVVVVVEDDVVPVPVVEVLVAALAIAAPPPASRPVAASAATVLVMDFRIDSPSFCLRVSSQARQHVSQLRRAWDVDESPVAKVAAMRTRLVWLVAALAALSAACAPAAWAAAPVAVPEATGVQKNLAVAVQLEGMQSGNAALSFTLTSQPAHGTLGPFVNTSCAYPFGATDCTTTVAYTPANGYAGPDSFGYEVSDGTSYSAPAAVNLTVSDNPPRAPVPAMPLTAAATAGTPLQLTITNVGPGSTVNWGDSVAGEAVAVTGSTGVISHTYAASGDYPITVTNRLATGLPSVASATTTAVVWDIGALGTGAVTVAPGMTGSLTIPGLVASLSAAVGDSPPPALFAASFPTTDPHYAAAAPAGQLLGAYDLRVVNAGGHDTLRGVFNYGTSRPAMLEYVDPVTNRWRLVKGSLRTSGSLVDNQAAHTISVVLDDSSKPATTDLLVTRFAAADISRPVFHTLKVSRRCVVPPAGGSSELRLSFSLSTSATVTATVSRQQSRPARGCGPRKARVFGAIHRARQIKLLSTGANLLVIRIAGPHARRSPLVNRLTPGSYTLTLVARNANGSSRTTRTHFSVA